MKVDVLDKSKNKTGEVTLPKQFSEEVRPDLIKRAVLSIQRENMQPYGASPDAGIRASSILSKRRRAYRGMYGHGISRTPRKILSRRGRRLHWVGAFAPGTVGGRRAHPPKAGKILTQKVNKKENDKAIRSSIAATVLKEVVIERGHSVPEIYPLILDKDFEEMNKTKEVISVLKIFGLEKELERASIKTVRAGKGKVRGRKYKKRVGPLIVVSDKRSKIAQSAKNIPGIDVANVKELNTELLAPGTHPGRLTIWTKSALAAMEKKKLFL